MSHVRLPFRAVLLAFACLLAPSAASAASAEGTEVEGYGFTFRLPSGFKPAGSSDESAGCERSYRRRVDDGEMRITVASSTQSGAAEAELETQLGARLDGLELAMDDPSGTSTTEVVSVTGASEAQQVVFLSETRSERRVTARRGSLLVTASLACPAEADMEASVIWGSLLASLRVDEPGGGLVRLLPYLVGLIALAGLGLRLLRRGAVPPAAPQRSADGFTPQFAAPATSPAYEPAPMPTHAPPVARESLGGYSRAADGMPLFDASAKARGVTDDTFKLPATTPRRAAPPPPTAEAVPADPKKAPILRPPTPMVRL